MKIRLLLPDFEFDYVGESYISGLEKYNETTKQKWLAEYGEENIVSSFRSIKFKKSTGREILDVNLDSGLKFINCFLIDNENEYGFTKNTLIVYYGILGRQRAVKDFEKSIKEHKKTN